MKKELKEGMGFICANLGEKERIWQRLTDAGYPMTTTWEDCDKGVLGIKWFETKFGSSESEYITDPLNESEFFDEWTPKAGDWVEVWDENKWYPRVFVCEWRRNFYYESGIDGRLVPTNQIRQIKPDTRTLQKAPDKLREVLGKPNLIVTQ